MERLEKRHAAISARVAARNRGGAAQAYALTQAIDCDLETAAREVGPASWWDEPRELDGWSAAALAAAPDAVYDVMQRAILQIHHLMLLILLHLPYMLRDPAERRYDYSKATCLRSARGVLSRFLAFRRVISSAYSCRHIDYAALMAAMTLLLVYLGLRPQHRDGGDDDHDRQRLDDRALAEHARDRMEHVALLNGDSLSRESARIIKQLLPILDMAAVPRDAPTVAAAAAAIPIAEPSSHGDGFVRLQTPHVGTVNIPRQVPPIATDSHIATPAAAAPNRPVASVGWCRSSRSSSSGGSQRD